MKGIVESRGKFVYSFYMLIIYLDIKGSISGYSSLYLKISSMLIFFFFCQTKGERGYGVMCKDLLSQQRVVQYVRSSRQGVGFIYL